jgi:transposase
MRIINRFRECGSVSDRKTMERPAILTEAKIADVKKKLQHSPSKSLRRLSAQSGISYTSVHIVFTACRN